MSIRLFVVGGHACVVTALDTRKAEEKSKGHLMSQQSVHDYKICHGTAVRAKKFSTLYSSMYKMAA